MKVVALCLLIANLVFFAWQYPQQQLMKDQQLTSVVHSLAYSDETLLPSLMLLKELPPAIVSKVVTVTVDKPFKIASREKKEPQPECWTLGPFTDNRQADQGLSLLTAQGVKGRTRERKSSVLAGYRVQLPGQGSKTAAQRTMRELRGRGINDIAMLTSKGRYIVSLGFFSRAESARLRNATVKKLGYQSLTEKIYRSNSAYWLDLYQHASVARVDKAWVKLADAYPEIRRNSIDCAK